MCAPGEFGANACASNCLQSRQVYIFCLVAADNTDQLKLTTCCHLYAVADTGVVFLHIMQALEDHVANLEEKLAAAHDRITELEVECDQAYECQQVMNDDHEKLRAGFYKVVDAKWELDIKMQEVRG